MKAKIYVIKNRLNNKEYIGSTKMKLNDRWNAHKSYNKATKLKCAINELGADKFYIELIEEFEYTDKQEIKDKESHYIRERNTIENGYNMYLAGRTQEERKLQKQKTDALYREKKGEELLKKKKEYYNQNKERIIANNIANQQKNKEARKDYMKKYAEKNKEKLADYHKNYYQEQKIKYNPIL